MAGSFLLIPVPSPSSQSQTPRLYSSHSSLDVTEGPISLKRDDPGRVSGSLLSFPEHQNVCNIKKHKLAWKNESHA